MITNIEITGRMLTVTAVNERTGHKDNTCVTIRFPNHPETLINKISNACRDIEDRVQREQPTHLSELLKSKPVLILADEACGGLVHTESIIQAENAEAKHLRECIENTPKDYNEQHEEDETTFPWPQQTVEFTSKAHSQGNT